MKHDELFWDKVDTSGGHNSCWEWQGCLDKGGYGEVRRNNRKYKTHRYALIQGGGGKEISKGLLACHKCDNRKCCNPNHLFLGTHEDNMQDMVDKGRSPSGVKNPSTKLTENQVREIKKKIKQGMMNIDIVKDYPVTQYAISKIRRGVQWKHIT